MPLLVTRTSLISMTLNVLRFFFINFRHRIVCSTMSVQKLIRLRLQGLGVSMLGTLNEQVMNQKIRVAPACHSKQLSAKSEPKNRVVPHPFIAETLALPEPPYHFHDRIEERAGKKLCYQSLRIKVEKVMAKTIARRKRAVRRDWTRAEVKELRQHSKDKTRVKTISRALKRTPGALRQKARVLGIPLGHRRTKKKRA